MVRALLYTVIAAIPGHDVMIAAVAGAARGGPSVMAGLRLQDHAPADGAFFLEVANDVEAVVVPHFLEIGGHFGAEIYEFEHFGWPPFVFVPLSYRTNAVIATGKIAKYRAIFLAFMPKIAIGKTTKKQDTTGHRFMLK